MAITFKQDKKQEHCGRHLGGRSCLIVKVLHQSLDQRLARFVRVDSSVRRSTRLQEVYG